MRFRVAHTRIEIDFQKIIVDVMYDFYIDDEIFHRDENDAIDFIFDVLKIFINLIEFVIFDHFFRQRNFHVVIDFQRVYENLNVIMFTFIVTFQNDEYQFFFKIELFNHFQFHKTKNYLTNNFVFNIQIFENFDEFESKSTSSIYNLNIFLDEFVVVIMNSHVDYVNSISFEFRRESNHEFF